MGTTKQLLPLGSCTIMGATLANIVAARADEVIVVTGAMGSQTGRIAVKAGARKVYNPRYRQGMATSLATGMSAAPPEAQLIMVALADQPLTRTETYNELLDRAEATGKGITIPVYQGKRGNPIVFHRRYFDELVRMRGDEGGRLLLQRHPGDILEVEVDDEGVVTNINTMQDYANLTTIWNEGSRQIDQKS